MVLPPAIALNVVKAFSVGGGYLSLAGGGLLKKKVFLFWGRGEGGKKINWLFSSFSFFLGGGGYWRTVKKCTFGPP